MPAYGSPALREFERDNPNACSVSVQFTIPAKNSRFWAIPLLGYVLKQIVLIPHIIVLFFVGVLVLLSQLILWLGIHQVDREDSGVLLRPYRPVSAFSAQRLEPDVAPHGARPSVNTPDRISSDPSTRQTPYPSPRRSTPSIAPTTIPASRAGAT